MNTAGEATLPVATSPVTNAGEESLAHCPAKIDLSNVIGDLHYQAHHRCLGQIGHYLGQWPFQAGGVPYGSSKFSVASVDPKKKKTHHIILSLRHPPQILEAPTRRQWAIPEK